MQKLMKIENNNRDVRHTLAYVKGYLSATNLGQNSDLVAMLETALEKTAANHRMLLDLQMGLPDNA